jgi:hypothetical protein
MEKECRVAKKGENRGGTLLARPAAGRGSYSFRSKLAWKPS